MQGLGLGRSKSSLFCSIAAMIGNTPVYRVQRWKSGSAELYLKLEQFNPGGSIKDRTAYGMIRQAERDGVLRPGIRIIESSSGNTAIGLAMLGCERGYAVTAICDRHLPAGKKARLLAFGADIVFLPQTPSGMDTVELRIAVANSLAGSTPNCISLGQYSNSANPEIHYETTGPEIWEAMDGRIDAVVAAVGTCGTISGVGRYLKEKDSKIQIVGVEPEGSIIFGGEDRRYLIQGGGLSFIPSILNRAVIDAGRKVSDAAAIGAAHEFARQEGWMIGGTGGLVVHALGQLAGELPGARLVGIIPDGGERYLDTLYDQPWLVQEGFRPLGNREDEPPRALAAAVEAMGCSLNAIPESNGISIEDLCRRVGVAVPQVASLANAE
jgi:cysteine synthase